MISLRNGERLLAVTLTFVAGFVDSVGFIHLGGVFLSFMSGNTTRSATSLVAGDTGLAVLAGSCILLFLIGVILGAIISRMAARRWDLYRAREAVLWSMAMVLGVTSLCVLLDCEDIAMLSLSVAIGMMNSVFERGGEVHVPLTYMTGTLVKMGQRFADTFFGGSHVRWLQHLMLWLSLSAGAVVGAMVYHAWQLSAVWAITVIVFLCAVVNQIIRDRRRRLGLPL